MIIELNLAVAGGDSLTYIDVNGFDSASIEFQMVQGSTFDSGVVSIKKTNTINGRPADFVPTKTVSAVGMVELNSRDWTKASYLVMVVTTASTAAARVTATVTLKKNDLSITDPVEVYDIGVLIAQGAISGRSHINKFGRNSSVASAGTEEIWDGSVAYTWPTTASVTHVRAAVDSATTQSMVIEVQGLDTKWQAVTQTATLDAGASTTEVILGAALRRVFRMKVLDAAVADQDIWAGPTGFATKQAVITAGNNQTLMAMYTVPADMTAYLVSWYATVNPATNLDPTSNPIKLWARDNAAGYAPQIKHVEGLTIGSEHHSYYPYPVFAEKTDIYLTASPVGKAADVSAGFDLILDQN